MSRSMMTMLLVPAAKNLLRPCVAQSGMPNFHHILARNFSSKRLTPAVTFISNESTKHLKSNPDLTQFSSEGRPLSVMLCWLAAKNNAVNKYAKFYLDQGFDVLVLRITPGQLLLPKTADPIIRNEMLPTLLSSDHEKKLIHGFSVGGYVFAQMLKYMHNDPTGKCQELMKTMVAQIWDSVVDVNGVSIGVSKSVFMESSFLQKALQNYIDFHMKIFYQIATKYYDESHEYYYNKPLNAPALFLASQIDQISTIDVITKLQDLWKKNHGIECTNKIWNNTQHVGHMRMYPEEYKLTVKMFLDRSGFQRGAKVVTDRKETALPAGSIPNVVYSNAI